MSYLLDTNILLRMIVPDDPMHLETVNTINALNAKGERLVIASQNLIELWNVCTRPLDKNGLGFTPETKYTFLKKSQNAYNSPDF